VQSQRGFLVSFSLAVLALALSCGGSSSSELFTGADSGADQAAPPEGAPQPEASSVDAPRDAVGSTGDSGGHVRDAAPADGQVPAYSVPCGTSAACEAPGQFCCLSGLPSNPAYACVSDSTSCLGLEDAKVSCTSSTQCPGGQVCCGHVLPPAVVSCQSTCNAANDYLFCDPSAPTDCPPGHKCVPSTRIVGYDRCN
jgi:hypothetical protein